MKEDAPIDDPLLELARTRNERADIRKRLDAIEATVGNLSQWEDFAARGFVVSVCCGPSGRPDGWRWSVQVLSPRGEEFDQPFAANSLTHALAIAELEIQRRGWR